MASILRDAFFKEGTHKVSVINGGTHSGMRPMVNGAKLIGGNLDNGMLVELTTRDSEGNKQCKAWEGTKQPYVINNNIAEGLFKEYNETDWKNYYVAEGEICNLYPVNDLLRQETNNYEVAAGKTLDYDKKVFYDVTNKKFIVDGTASSTVVEVGTVEEKETDLGWNAQAGNSIRIQYKSL